MIRFEEPATYDLLTRARDALGHRLSNMLRFAITIARLAAGLAGYAVLLGAADPWLLLAVAAPALPSVWIRARSAAATYGSQYETAPVRREMAYTQDLLVGRASGHELRVFDLYAHLRDRWREAHTRWRSQSTAQTWAQARAATAVAVLATASYALAIGLVADLIATRRLTLGDYVVLAGAARTFQGHMEQLLQQVGWLLRDLPALGDLHAYLHLAHDARALRGERAFPAPLARGIEVRHLSFAYPGGGAPVLADISVTLRPDQLVAVVGANGAGKSTLMKLLLGLYRPSGGTVAYDGVPVQDISPVAVAARCAAVFQDSARFRRTLREELAPGDEALQGDDARLWASLEALGLGDRFRGLPHGLDTILDPSLAGPGEGAELSGGEWQRLAIARAVVRDPQVLILDEPTAALDPNAELEVYRRFAALARGRIAVMVSHRMGSAHLADRILVLDHGTITEDGTHADLLAADGLYARLFLAQARWYRPGPGAGVSADA